MEFSSECADGENRSLPFEAIKKNALFHLDKKIREHIKPKKNNKFECSQGHSRKYGTYILNLKYSCIKAILFIFDNAPH